ncbi:hypothetical protein CCR97_09155 [Rhodoplanes elegans]|uniref:Uncharacterized protein n=1 Tax=Rhodoplanes elegans TaxID=29408 RepID=A0A327KHG4_9BRAD|nr:hypothetical protein [Rhodoplanes elegans]RAI38130.1 hypothetical protein CH338_13700 [Rhodoplanes elegans]
MIGDATEALVHIFSAGCILDAWLSCDPERASDAKVALINVAMENLDAAQDALLQASGLSIEDVRIEYLKRWRGVGD